jgi:hypothetical protein
MSKRMPKPRRRKVPAKFEESVNIVPCCRHIQRRMIRNTQRAAARDINPRRKRRAKELPTAIQAELKTTSQAAAQKPATVAAQANVPVQTNKVVMAPAQPVLQLAINGFKNCIKAVGSFTKRKISFWRGSQWQAIRKET